MKYVIAINKNLTELQQLQELPNRQAEPQHPADEAVCYIQVAGTIDF